MKQQSPQVHPRITQVMPIVEGVVSLLYPYAEGALHDLQQGKVVAMYNNISRRKVGDPSPVTELGVPVKDFPDVFEPYYKTNWDGTALKCVSVTLRDESGMPVGLVCINFDTSVFRHMNLQIEKLISVTGKSLNPVDQFSSNWQQQVTEYIDGFSKRHNVSLQTFSRSQKAGLVRELYSHGIFNYKEAVPYIGKLLGVSRATIYNYLKEEK